MYFVGNMQTYLLVAISIERYFKILVFSAKTKLLAS